MVFSAITLIDGDVVAYVLQSIVATLYTSLFVARSNLVTPCVISSL